MTVGIIDKNQGAYILARDITGAKRWVPEYEFDAVMDAKIEE